MSEPYPKIEPYDHGMLDASDGHQVIGDMRQSRWQARARPPWQTGVPAAPQAGDEIPEAERNGSLVEAYHRLLINPNPTIYEKAARDWCDWEMAIVAVHPNHKPHPRYERSDLRLCFARLVTHYWRHNAWLPDGIFLQQIDRLAGSRPF